MNLPDGVTEAQVLDTIKKVCKRLAHKFKFAYHTAEDIEQDGTIIALKSLEKWDGVRPLENFLYRCVHNGLFNNKRKKFTRPDKPCPTCPFYDPHCAKSYSECTEFNDKNNCELYTNWINRNTAKKNVIQPIDITNIRDENEDNMKTADTVVTAEQNELWKLIDKHLDIKLRGDYIKIKSGVKIPKHRRSKVEAAILAIVQEHCNEWSQEG